MPILDLTPAIIPTNEDDLNWIPWLVVAHQDPAKVDKNVIAKHAKEFNTQWIADPAHEEFLDGNWIMQPEYEDAGGDLHGELLDYFSDLGYTVLHPGKLTWIETL